MEARFPKIEYVLFDMDGKPVFIFYSRSSAAYNATGLLIDSEKMYTLVVSESTVALFS